MRYGRRQIIFCEPASEHVISHPSCTFQQVSSVSTNVALTARKALSLCLSVWWFKNDWNVQLGFGAFMVFFGSLLYAVNTEEKANKNK